MITPPITLTGIDELTDLLAVDDLAQRGVEIGVLLSLTPEGRNRYPSLPFIDLAVDVLGSRLAIHICGKAARRALHAHEFDRQLIFCGRIQINGAVTAKELIAIRARYPGHQIITQHQYPNGDLAHVAMPDGSHALLVDGSGGRGILPELWHAPRTDKPVGFAGGLSLNNLERELPRIAEVARPGCWIDMESSLRNAADRFDISTAQAVVDMVRRTYAV